MGGGMLQNFWCGGKGSGLAKANPPPENTIKSRRYCTTLRLRLGTRSPAMGLA